VHVCVLTARPTGPHPLLGSSLRQNVISHNTQSLLQPPPSSSPIMTLSTSCPQHLDSRFLDSSLDSLQLTQMEIDAIRNMGRTGSGASSPSTPTSQLSHPDFNDPRPDIYRFTYDISPRSQSRASDSASVSAEGGECQPAELPLDSKFDDIVVGSMERSANRHAVQRRKVNIASTCEPERTEQTSLKHDAENSETETLPTVVETSKSVQAASKPETHVAVASVPTPVQSNEMVVSVGDALVAVPHSSELVTSDMQQHAVTASNDVSTAGPSTRRDVTSSRIHKGSYISLLNLLILSSISSDVYSYLFIPMRSEE